MHGFGLCLWDLNEVRPFHWEVTQKASRGKVVDNELPKGRLFRWADYSL